MTDPVAIATLGGSAALVVKILGPTADYIGAGIQQWTEQRVKNIQRVFHKAENKLGPALDAPGIVPPRVLKGVLEEGQFADDELGAEYLGGVLATSRTATGRDDRAASLAGLIGRLSTYQLRSHYIMYSQARSALAGTELNLGEQSVRLTQSLFVPFPGYQEAMEFSEEEFQDFTGILLHVLGGLLREGLIEDHFHYGGSDKLQTEFPQKDFGHGGVIYRVSPLGMELFCAAHGIRGNPIAAFVDPDTDFSIEGLIKLEGDFGLVADLPDHQT